jgi:hypothetical protein
LGGEQCQTKRYVLDATVKEQLPVFHVMALAKNSPQVFQPVTVKNATEPADVPAMFVMVRAKSNISRLMAVFRWVGKIGNARQMLTGMVA